MPIPGIALLLAKKASMKDKPQEDVLDGGKDDAEESDVHSKDDTIRAVMKSFIDSVHDKDVESAKQSFKDLMDLCDDDGEDGEDGDY